MSLSKSPNSFLPKSLDENIRSYANLLPISKQLWSSARDRKSKMYALLSIFATELSRIQSLEYQLASQYIPNFNDSFIEYWERMLGIPDECFSINTSDEKRRRNIIIKLVYMRLVTVQDYEILGAVLGLNVEVTPATIDNPYRWLIDIDSPSKEGFPYTFPFVFGGNESEIFQCIVNKQKPAHTEVVFTFSRNIYSDNNGNMYVDNAGNFYVDGGIL